MADSPPPCLACNDPLEARKDKSGNTYLTCPKGCMKVFPLTTFGKKKLKERYGPEDPKAPPAQQPATAAAAPQAGEPARSAGDAKRRTGGAGINRLLGGSSDE